MSEKAYQNKRDFCLHIENSLHELCSGLKALTVFISVKYEEDDIDQTLWLTQRLMNGIDSALLFVEETRASIPS